MINKFGSKRKKLIAYRNLRARQGKKNPTDDRLRLLFDGGEYQELFAGMKTKDPLAFPDYEEKLKKNRQATGNSDACSVGIGTVEGISCIAAELSKAFLMGSMGTVAGEKLARSFEEADRQRLPLVIFSASGGARMQEGMFSLLQMAKTSAAAERFKSHGGLYISVLTHPTTGGVSASYASLGDIILAEPKALIGFAGPRVIEQTIGEKLPKGFQRAEFQQAHGFVDRIVEPKDMKREIATLFRLHGFCGRAEDSRRNDMKPGETVRRTDGSAEAPLVSALQKVKKDRNFSEQYKSWEERKADAGKKLTSYERVQLARDKDRPKIYDFIEQLFDGFVELSGDRLGKEDQAIVGGIALFHGKAVTVIGHHKGKNLQENMTCNFGMPGPEGYRKALRLMRQAEKFRRPVITFIDTPGAYPGKAAEENGQSIAIAENLAAMSSLKTPIIAIVTGEGNSGGALAIGVGDEIWMLENAVYSVLSPEGFASILWKDAGRMREACDVMKMTAEELYKAGLADRVIPEPAGGVQKNLPRVCKTLEAMLEEALDQYGAMSTETLLDTRYRKYRSIEGKWHPVIKPERKYGN